MNETILKIEEVRDYKLPEWGQADGFVITTDKQEIKLLIGNGQCRCESWGYFISEDDTKPFIGAKISEITLTDTALKTHLLEANDLMYDGHLSLDAGDIMFVNIVTDRGVLQFAAYNSHNGYYGHSAYVFSEQLTLEECL